MEERRRTKVIPHLFEEGRLVTLVYGVLIRGSEQGGKKCFREFDQQQIRSLRGMPLVFFMALNDPRMLTTIDANRRPVAQTSWLWMV